MDYIPGYPESNLSEKRSFVKNLMPLISMWSKYAARSCHRGSKPLFSKQVAKRRMHNKMAEASRRRNR